MTEKRYIKNAKEPTRTRSWEANATYDNFLAISSLSDLEFLQHKYDEEKKSFRNHFDLNQKEFLNEYNKICRRKHMIDEELGNRLNFTSTQQNSEYFDSAKGIAFDGEGKEMYAVAFDDAEENIVYVNTKASANSDCRTEDDETDYEMYSPVGKLEMYEKWNYIEILKENEIEE